MRTLTTFVVTASVLALSAGIVHAQTATPVATVPAAPIAATSGLTLTPTRITTEFHALDVHNGGRANPSVRYVAPTSAPGQKPPFQNARVLVHQFPGVYFESAFSGPEVDLKFDDAINILNVSIDGQTPTAVSKPGTADLAITGLSDGPHTIRVEKVTESQWQSAGFGGFYVPKTGKTLSAPPPSARQIEFIGDSYTVGYGNTASTHSCSADDIWAHTDTTQTFGPLTAKHYHADYQINAVSGRGVVRNFDGGIPGTNLPDSYYPFTLFDQSILYADPKWKPQIIVIGLGTNDFSMPLNAGEKWATRDALHADFEAAYIRFVKYLRSKNPNARFILMATDQADGEIQAEVQKVITALQTGGESRIAFVPMNGLSFAGCNGHPTTADDATVSQSLIGYIDAHPDLWQGK